MNQSVNVILDIAKVHAAPQRVLDCGSGLGGLNLICGPNPPTPSA